MKTDHRVRSPFEGLPTLSQLLEFFEAEEDRRGFRNLEEAISSKRLTRDAFYEQAAWAILVSGFKWEVAQRVASKANACGFPSDWKVLGEWEDDDFDGWCKVMAAQLDTPQQDLAGKFRDKWWAIWDLAWYLLKFDTEADFRRHFFGGKTQGRELTDADVRRLRTIKQREGRLYMIGEANRYFVLRNLGGDFLKPDVWIEAFCRWYGDIKVSELARQLKDQGIRCGRFDAYCWSYCEREVDQADRLEAHFNEVFDGGKAAHIDHGGDSVSTFEDTVWRTEKLRIVVRDRRSRRIEGYAYERAANQDWTLSKFIGKRLQPALGDREVTVVAGDGGVPNGRALLRTVRASYGN